MRLRCFTCGKSITNELPNDTYFRASATCPECIEQQPDPAQIIEDADAELAADQDALVAAKKARDYFKDAYNYLGDRFNLVVKERNDAQDALAAERTQRSLDKAAYETALAAENTAHRAALAAEREANARSANDINLLRKLLVLARVVVAAAGDMVHAKDKREAQQFLASIDAALVITDRKGGPREDPRH